MTLQTQILPYRLQFKQPAGTSRGVYHTHDVWYVMVSDSADPARWGIGECAPLPDLSCDFSANYAQNLALACKELAQTGRIDLPRWRTFPSILFGLETALRQFQQGGFQLWPTPFSQGQSGIAINGLIWMGDFDAMRAQIEAKLAQGFGCIKLKIGAIDFEAELALLHKIRQRYSASDITLRVDANGAFLPHEVDEKLAKLARFELHSIEQPIAAGQWADMAALIARSPIPIALDEELIGHHTESEKQSLLTTLKPHYLVLKPSLHGGISGTQTWISLAEQHKIDWWITSALESNIGLNAVAQLASTYDNPLPQGLGTGLLYHNNLPMPLHIHNAMLHFQSDKTPTQDELRAVILAQSDDSSDKEKPNVNP